LFPLQHPPFPCNILVSGHIHGSQSTPSCFLDTSSSFRLHSLMRYVCPFFM
jgi:hypothetical protein